MKPSEALLAGAVLYDHTDGIKMKIVGGALEIQFIGEPWSAHRFETPDGLANGIPIDYYDDFYSDKFHFTYDWCEAITISIQDVVEESFE